MAIVSAGYAGTVNDAQWALMSRFFGQDFGVLNLTELNCTQQSGARSFNLSAGTLYGRGVMDVSDAVVNVAPTVPVSGGQWFLIVARRIWATKVTSLVAVAGPTTTTTPPTSRPSSYPTLQRNPGVQDDQPLWWVWVNASNTTTVMFDQRIFSAGRVANFNAIPPAGFLTRGSQLTVESVRMTLADNGTAWQPVTMRVSGTTAQRTEFTDAGLAIDGMEWHDTTDNSDYDRRGGSWRRASGLILAGNISAQNTINIDGLTGFEVYEVFIDLPTSSQANDVNLRLRSGGVTDAAALYDREFLYGAVGVAGATQTLGANNLGLGGASRSNKAYHLMIMGLNRPTRTSFQWRALMANNYSDMQSASVVASHRTLAAYDGINLEANVGTVTGFFEVYGR